MKFQAGDLFRSRTKDIALNNYHYLMILSDNQYVYYGHALGTIHVLTPGDKTHIELDWDKIS